MDQVHFNAFDLLLTLTLGFSIIIGLARGFIRETLGLAAWGGACALTLQGYEWPRILFESWISDPMIIKVASRLFVFCGSLVIFLLITQWISYHVQNSMAQSVDRSLGIVFGFIRGLFLICALYTASLFQVLPQHQPPIVKTSKSHTWLVKSALFLKDFLPPSFQNHEIFQKSLQELQQDVRDPQDLTREISSPPVEGENPSSN